MKKDKEVQMEFAVLPLDKKGFLKVFSDLNTNLSSIAKSLEEIAFNKKRGKHQKRKQTGK